MSSYDVSTSGSVSDGR